MLRNGTVAFCHAVWRYASLNLMAIALIVAGAGVLGVAPALAACCWAVSRDDERAPGQLVAGMWRQWRAEFFRANLALLPVAGVTALALLVASRTGGPVLALSIGVAVLSLQFALAIVYGISQRQGGVAEAFGNGARLFIACPLRLLGLLIAIAMLCLIAIWQPLFAIYGLLSVTARAAVVLLGSAFAQPIEAATARAHRLPSREVHPQEIRA